MTLNLFSASTDKEIIYWGSSSPIGIKRKGWVPSYPLCIRGDTLTYLLWHTYLDCRFCWIMGLMMFSLALFLKQSQARCARGCGMGWHIAGNLLTQVCFELQHPKWSTDLCFHQWTTFCFPNPAHGSILQGSLELKHFISVLLLHVNWPEWVCRAWRAGFGWRSVSFCSIVAFLLLTPQQEQNKTNLWSRFLKNPLSQVRDACIVQVLEAVGGV